MKRVNRIHNVRAPTSPETVVVVFAFVKLDMYQSTTPVIQVSIKKNSKCDQYLQTFKL